MKNQLTYLPKPKPCNLLPCLLLMLTLLVFMSGCVSIRSKENTDQKFIDKGKNIALFVRSDGLYAVDLPSGAEICLDASPNVNKDTEFQLTLAQDNKTAAYVKNDDLFLVSIDFNNLSAQPLPICEEVSDYIFIQNALVYSPKSGGLYSYDPASKEKEALIASDKYYYYWLVASTDRVFARRVGTSWEEQDVGITEIKLTDGSETLVIPSILPDEKGSLGEYYRTIGISADNKFLYLLRGPHSGSLSSDGVSMGIYNIEKREFTPLDIVTLPKRENFSVNPTKPELAFIYGGNREMSFNKKVLSLLDPLSGEITMLTADEDGMGSMHPCFFADGQRILFSAGEPIEDFEEALEAILEGGSYYEHHSIWEHDFTSGKSRIITETGFNIWPRYIIGGKAISFVRINGNVFDLYVYEDGQERLVAANIDSSCCGYYGYYNLTPVLTVQSVNN